MERLRNELELARAQLARERAAQADQLERANLDAFKFELLVDMYALSLCDADRLAQAAAGGDAAGRPAAAAAGG